MQNVVEREKERVIARFLFLLARDPGLDDFLSGGGRKTSRFRTNHRRERMKGNGTRFAEIFLEKYSRVENSSRSFGEKYQLKNYLSIIDFTMRPILVIPVQFIPIPFLRARIPLSFLILRMPEESRVQLPNRSLSLSRPRIGKRRICDVRDLGVVLAKAASNAEDISRRSAIMLGRGSRWRIDGSRELGCWVK